MEMEMETASGDIGAIGAISISINLPDSTPRNTRKLPKIIQNRFHCLCTVHNRTDCWPGVRWVAISRSCLYLHLHDVVFEEPQAALRTLTIHPSRHLRGESSRHYESS